MYFERLVIEAGDDTFSLDLHHRMTVIAGVGGLEREGLITELLGALGPGRSGVHLEIQSDAGARYAIFRPAGARHRVVDTEAAADVTDQFTNGDRLDVLERAGLHRSSARRQLCMQPDDLVTRSRVEKYILALARIDQGRLWDVADRVKERERRLAETAQAAGSDAEDAVMFEEIERRHRAFELAQEAHERVRYLSFLVGAGAALVAVCISVLYGFWLATPFLLLAIAATAASIVFWQRVERARRDEEAALREAGTSSYLTFQINRVNGLLTSDAARRSMMRAAEEHRAALAEWRVLVGDIPVTWAVEHAADIRRQAARLRESMPNRNPMAITMSPRRGVRGRAGPCTAPAAGHPEVHRRRGRELPAAARRRAGRGRPADEARAARAADEGVRRSAGDLPHPGRGRRRRGPGSRPSPGAMSVVEPVSEHTSAPIRRRPGIAV